MRRKMKTHQMSMSLWHQHKVVAQPLKRKRKLMKKSQILKLSWKQLQRR
uniref:Uncharacterized protein n=1 Tax=Rhizophora mucronata TaxID=61149 RepID=A0A2P2IWM0_RHIMU